jgi:hypothetical protein
MGFTRHRLVFVPALAAAAWGCSTSATPASRPHERVIGSVKLGDVIFRDNFDDPVAGGLPKQASVPGAEQGYRDGEYFLRLSPSHKDQISLTGPDAVLANTHVEVDVRFVATTEMCGVGVACRVSLEEGVAIGAYVLSMSPATGWFALARLDPGRVVRLVADQFSEAIRQGDASNHLELTCAGSTIIVRINGMEVASVRDGTHDNGHVAIVVSRSTSIGLEARFDNLVIHEALVTP